jgi:asparagine synthase (glutamine-hydrolysing)
VCGICGIVEKDVQRPADEGALAAMCEALRHRGPDDAGIHLSGHVGLAMRRLRVIDLAGGRQPMANEDHTVWIVLNGEIYNYRDLRADLEGRGHVFRSHSDTETILHLYEERGDDCVHALVGMFAFAVWDGRRRRLLLARDRLGIKPLYYVDDANRLLFGSELKALAEHPATPRALDPEGLDLYLRFGYIPAPQTIWRGVRKLSAGHLLALENDVCRVRAYWDVPFPPEERPRREAECAEEMIARLDEAVRSHLHADVPLGAFLSGGVDSSAVVALMSRHASQPVETFSIGFRELWYNELDYAREVARLCGARHHEFILEPDVRELLDLHARHFDEPFADAAALPTFLLSRMTRRHVTVALTGDGGDEVFAGYNRYWTEWFRRWYAAVPEPVRRLALLPLFDGLAALIPPQSRRKVLAESAARRTRLQSLSPLEGYISQFSPFGPDTISRLLTPEARVHAPDGPPEAVAAHFRAARGLTWLRRAQYVDMKTSLPEQMLAKVDRTTMAFGLEARVPLLDHRVVEVAAAVPSRYMMGWRRLKRFFKAAVRDLVPAVILDRPKHGFQVPLAAWFRGELQDLIRQRLAPAELRKHGLFQPRAVERLLREHQAGVRNHDFALFALLAFQMWWDRYGVAPARGPQP